MIDPQLKRGMLDICVLSLLRRKDSYGYQIIKDLSGCIEMSESTLYPILRRLEAAGLLEQGIGEVTIINSAGDPGMIRISRSLLYD